MMPPDTHATIVADLVKALEETLAFSKALEAYHGRGTGGRRGGQVFCKARAALARAKQFDLDRARVLTISAAALQWKPGPYVVIPLRSEATDDAHKEL